MKISRRDFIGIGAKGFLGGIIAYSSIPSLLRNLMPSDGVTRSAPVANRTEYDWEKHYWGFVCDNERCIGCGRCVVACKLENKVPWEPEYNRTWERDTSSVRTGRFLSTLRTRAEMGLKLSIAV